MDLIEQEALLDDVASVVKQAIQASVSPLFDRISALEKQVADAAKPKEIDVEGIVGLAVKAIAPEIAGIRADIQAVQAKADTAAELSRPDAIAEIVKSYERPAFSADMQAAIDDAARKAISELPTPENGKSVTVEDVQPLILAEVEKAVGAISIPVPKDGIGLAGAIIDRSGNLVVTMTDGSTKELGPVVGREGRSVAVDDLRPIITEEVEKRVSELPEPEKGKDAEPAVIKRMVDEAVAEVSAEGKFVTAELLVAKLNESMSRYNAELEKAASEFNAKLASLPEPVPGKDVDMNAVNATLQEAIAKCEADVAKTVETAQAAVSEAIAAIPEPVHGKSITVDDVRPLIQETVAQEMAKIPVPAGIESAEIKNDWNLLLKLSDGREIDVGRVVGWDGVDIDMERIQEQIAKTIKELWDNHPKPENGKDGIGLTGALLDKEGHLIVTLSNGKLENVGKVCGENGKDINPENITRQIKELFDAVPKPKDGIDGVGFDDMSVEYDGEKTVTFIFAKDDTEKLFKLNMPIMLFRGAYKEGTEYTVGDTVSFGGSSWTAIADTKEKPGTGKDWQVSSKKGRDGKDFDPANPSKPGPVKL